MHGNGEMSRGRLASQDETGKMEVMDEMDLMDEIDEKRTEFQYRRHL